MLTDREHYPPCPFVDAVKGDPWYVLDASLAVDSALVGAAQSMRAAPSWKDRRPFEHVEGEPRGTAWYYFGSTPMLRKVASGLRPGAFEWSAVSGEISRGA